MELLDEEFTAIFPPYAPPPYVSVSPFPHQSSRRLSSHFTPPTRPIRSAKQLAWVSLQGRIVNAEEASSAKAIGGNLSCEEAVAWEMFSPMHRILIVAVIAVAAANSMKNKLIFQLKKSVEIRDQVLLGMQEKLDNLCEQVNYFHNKPDISSYNFEVSDCGCRHCDHHQLPSEYDKEMNSSTKVADNYDIVKYKTANDAEQEERRMSDLSDWAPSVSSSIDVQWNAPVEQDISKLQKECEDKDARINELSAFLNSAESYSSKRISELEDVIRRKNMLITKLRKDMMVLEQKVMHLTRLRRPSSSKSNSSSKKLPTMSDNLIYDMDSTTSPSDDSDSASKKKHRLPELNKINKERHHAPIPSTPKTNKSSEQPLRPVSPLKEKSLNQQTRPLGLSKSKESKSSSGGSKSRNGSSSNSTKSKVLGAHKRWT